jgi:hypothetical protein
MTAALDAPRRGTLALLLWACLIRVAVEVESSLEDAVGPSVTIKHDSSSRCKSKHNADGVHTKRLREVAELQLAAAAIAAAPHRVFGFFGDTGTCGGAAPCLTFRYQTQALSQILKDGVT